MRKHYSTQSKTRTAVFVILLIAAVAAGILIGSASGRAAEEKPATCWTMCRPGSQVNVRRHPDKKSEKVGYLDACDSFKTDGESRDGWIHVLDIGEYGDGWVYAGYVVTEEPKAVFQNYVCVAKRQAACRKWIGGPQVDGSKWIRNGSNVSVFYIADGWAITSRGYIQAEWLEVNPE